jgi:molybdate transport system substrate-binding protein
MRRRRVPGLGAVLALALVASACASAPLTDPGTGSPSARGSDASAAPGAKVTELTVFAAASLRSALADLLPAYEAAHPGTSVLVSTGSSAALRAQIELGAPADLFLAADTKNPAAIIEDGLATSEPIAFAANRLTIVVPAEGPAKVVDPSDLAADGTRIVAAGAEVPITGYAMQAVERLARQPGYPPDFAIRYQANVVSREEDATAVVTKIALGEGDAAIVYATDVATATGVRTVDLPPSANVSATYAGVVVDGAHPTEARTLLDWLAGPDGRAALARSGFLPPP